MPDALVCPKCGSPEFKKVGFTWWGGAVGPAILKHVKCGKCGATFNGRTGQANTTGIIVYSVVLGVIALAVVLIFAFAT